MSSQPEELFNIFQDPADRKGQLGPKHPGHLAGSRKGRGGPRGGQAEEGEVLGQVARGRLQHVQQSHENHGTVEILDSWLKNLIKISRYYIIRLKFGVITI